MTCNDGHPLRRSETDTDMYSSTVPTGVYKHSDSPHLATRSPQVFHDVSYVSSVFVVNCVYKIP